MKNVKKVGMRGFMCSSPASTAVCMTSDSRSVIVPKRQIHRTSSTSFVDHSMLMSNPTKYSKLVEPPRRSVSLGDSRILTLSSALKRDRDRERERERERERQPNPIPSSIPPPTLALPPQPGFQEVVLRVSIHCQGCAGKIKKHLSKMEGVTSFSIDLEAKRVTVMGNVSPVGVMESVSKVKKAELWPC